MGDLNQKVPETDPKGMNVSLQRHVFGGALEGDLSQLDHRPVTAATKNRKKINIKANKFLNN
jgi:hypothetical protein